MAAGAYSFIDIAVLDSVRARLAAGDALAILSTDLEQVIWANGPGADIFGYPDIESIMGASARLGLATRRQIAATAGFPDIGQEKSLLIRISTGVTSRAVAFLASTIVLPDGEKAILLAAPAGVRSGGRDTAERAISGFTEAGYFAALVDGDGRIVASSEGFSRLGIAEGTLMGLVHDVREERDRLLKRLIPAGSALFPAGFARLTDEPAQHLLLVVESDQAPARENDTEAADPGAPTEVDHPDDSPAQIQPPHILEQGNPPVSAPPQAAPSEGLSESLQREDKPVADGDVDHWYFEKDERRQVSAEAPEPPQPVRISEPAAAAAAVRQGPVRFVWRTDAEGRFSAVSDEFGAAVGPTAADIIGRRFRDVANAFGMDPEGEIAGLLERRDTWSGRCVLWPIAGTALKAPVDLAALPIYSRDRVFEGFRGFGVARMNDALDDPEAIGLALVSAPPAPAEEIAPPPEEAEAPRQQEEPSPPRRDQFRGEVPALVIDNTPERRFSDKVIRLAEHRPPTVERSLTPVERNAFREIGDRLRKESGGAVVPVQPHETEPASKTGSEMAAAREPLPDDFAGVARVENEEAEAAKSSKSTAEAESSAEGTATAVEQLQDAVDVQEGEATPSAAEPRQDAPVPSGEVAAAGPAHHAPAPANDYLPAAFTDRTPERPRVDVSILSQLPIPILIHSGDLLHYANREFLDLTGYPSLADFRTAGGLGALFADPYKADGIATPSDHHLRLKRQSGEEMPVDALLQSVPWNGGKALMLAVKPLPAQAAPAKAARDETVKELEARLEELRTILDTATDGVVLIAAEGTIRSISRPAEALFGFDSANIVGQPFTSLFAVESQRAARDYLNGLAENGVASVLNDGREVIGREAQGRFIPLFMTIGKLPGDGGYCAVLRDITQWKRAEEELTQARAQAERSSSQKSNFLARVSHEIRTPLNAIIGFSELMLDEKFGPIGSDRYRDYLRDINRSGNHVLDLVNDLLDISKIEAGELEMSYEAVSLNETLAETVAMMQPQANRERVIIRSSFASKLPEVVADLRSIRQIALNLLSNAIRYTQAGGQVIISTSYEASGDIVMRVRDTGIGMTQAEIEQALKPFKQINALKRGRGDGTGLGLPLTKAMVEANRARFAINSTPGEGTMVEVTFPSTRVLAD